MTHIRVLIFPPTAKKIHFTARKENEQWRHIWSRSFSTFPSKESSHFSFKCRIPSCIFNSHNSHQFNFLQHMVSKILISHIIIAIYSCTRPKIVHLSFFSDAQSPERSPNVETPVSPTPSNSDSTPLDFGSVFLNPEHFFEALFSSHMYTIMAEETNKYAQRKLQRGKFFHNIYFYKDPEILIHWLEALTFDM